MMADVPFERRDKLKFDNARQETLFRELDKIDKIERSDMRMLETARHRLRSKLKRFEVTKSQSSGYSDVVDRSCYRCTGATKANETLLSKNPIDLYHLVYSMLFTNGEIDPDKVLCLHVLAAHYANNSGSDKTSSVRPITPLIERGKKENFSGAWNSLLPCYVLEIERNFDDVTINLSDDIKRQKNPLVMKEVEEEIVKDLQLKYENYVRNNSEVGLALTTNYKLTKMVPNGIGKMTVIPPHVYSLLGAAHELKIKQAIAEESRGKKFRPSNSSIKNLDDQSISFRLEDEDDAVSRRLMIATSGPRNFGSSKISAFRSLISRKSATSSRRTDPSITTLERASLKSSSLPPFLEDVEIGTEIVTIKPTDRAIGNVASKTSSTKSPFRNFSSIHNSRSPCSNSITSGISGSLEEPRKTCRPIFINSPANSPDLRNREYETVSILINNQMQALVHSVLDVLERVNPIKMRRILSTANSPDEIRKMLLRPEIQLFVNSLVGQPLISSPNSFVVSTASVLNEIDPRFEGSIEKELVATTLVVPLVPQLHHLVQEIRKNIFVDPDRTAESKFEEKVQSFGSQKRKLMEFKSDPRKESEMQNHVFDVETSCCHSDVKDTKMTCPCCYAKWKESLAQSEQSKVPDYSFLVNHESEFILNNAAAINSLEINLHEKVKQEEMRKSQFFNEKKKARSDYLENRSLNKLSKTKTSKLIPISTKANEENPQSSFETGTTMTGVKISVDHSTADCNGCKNLQKRSSGITLKEDSSSPKCQFKPWKASRNTCYLDHDRLILQRMTNPQRILVGQMCASLKTRKINTEGLVKEKTPLAALITPVLSRDTLRILTKGTGRTIPEKRESYEVKDNCETFVTEKLTGPVLAEIRQAVAESETKLRLASFLRDKI